MIDIRPRSRGIDLIKMGVINTTTTTTTTTTTIIIITVVVPSSRRKGIDDGVVALVRS